MARDCAPCQGQTEGTKKIETEPLQICQEGEEGPRKGVSSLACQATVQRNWGFRIDRQRTEQQACSAEYASP